MRRGYTAAGCSRPTVRGMAANTRGPLPPGVYWRRRLACSVSRSWCSSASARCLTSGATARRTTRPSRPGQRPWRARRPPSRPTSPRARRAARATEGTATGEGPGWEGPETNAHPHADPHADPVAARPDRSVRGPGRVHHPDHPVADRRLGRHDPAEPSDASAVACTWQLSSETMRLNIVSGHDQIWLSNQCPDAIPAQDVVVRLASVTQVPVQWNARRSDEECSDRTAWALPGFYHVRAGVLGGEPTDVQFELVAPAPATVTQTAEPQRRQGREGREGRRPGAGRTLRLVRADVVRGASRRPAPTGLRPARSCPRCRGRTCW